MKVSVIIPVYNTGKYLPSCIDSVIAQTYSDLEVVIVDDGSTDESSQICDNYAKRDNRIRVIHQPNRGVSAARNLGVAQAKGDYIAFLDSDDIMHPKMIAHLLGLMERHGTEAAFASYTKVPNELNTKGTISLYTPEKAIELSLYQRGLDCSLWGKLFPAEAVKKTHQDEGRRYEDLSVFYKIYENIKGKIAATSAQLYYYRDNPESFINTLTVSRLDVLAVTEEIENHYANHPVLSKAARDRRYSANYNMLILTTGTSMQHAADRCWKIVKKYRREALLNPQTRLTNKLGAVLSIFGRRAILRVAGLIGKPKA